MKLKLYSIVFLALLMAGCANRGIGPQGGPKDSIPPIPVEYEPLDRTTNFIGKRIEITFNEYLQLDNIATNLLMSPPQQKTPEVKIYGKKLIVQFADSLRDSTTYTLDFGNAVCDYTEKNPVRGFSYCFSTGPTIDTLEIHGMVYGADDLNPKPGIIVGIHENMHDSAFTKEPFLRIAKTDSAGHFRIGNVRPGTYRLYAVDDVSRDYRFTPGEAIAFADELVTAQAPDTTQLSDSTAEHAHEHTQLFLFKMQQKRLYLQRTLRDKRNLIRVLFSSAPDSLPQIRALNDSLNYHIRPSRNGDTLAIWLLDSASIKQDTLFFETTYRRTDSVFNYEWAVDTIRAVWRAPRLTAKAQEAQDRANRNRRLEISSNARKGFELYDTLRINCSTLLASIETNSIRLFERVDTILTPVAYTLLPYDTLPMELKLLTEWKPGAKYELQIDSATFHDAYGISHIAGSYPFEVKKLEDYSTLRVKIAPFNPQARVQVLNNKDQVVRETAAQPDGAYFPYLKPDGYYIRMYIDEDENQCWTTGNWDTKQQPERVYYFPNKIQTKSNWDFEEEWDYNAIEQTQAKPRELIQAAATKKK